MLMTGIPVEFSAGRSFVTLGCHNDRRNDALLKTRVTANAQLLRCFCEK